MKFILELWPDIEGDPGVTAHDLLLYAIQSATTNPSLIWDVVHDNGEVLAENISADGTDGEPFDKDWPSKYPAPEQPSTLNTDENATGVLLLVSNELTANMENSDVHTPADMAADVVERLIRAYKLTGFNRDVEEL